MVVDQYGIKQIYRSSALKQKSFFLPMSVDPNSTELTLPGTFAIIGSPLFFVRQFIGSPDIDYWELGDFSDSPFLVFLSQSGFIPGPNCTLNHSTAVAQGYATSPEDWKNVEITGHFFIKTRSGADVDAMFMTGREGIENTTINNCCSVTGYGALIETSESTDKEGFVSLYKRPHSGLLKSKFLAPVSPAGFSSFFQRWFGWKLVIRNVEVQGQKEVHVETYFSPSDQFQDLENWVLVYKVIDYVGANWSNIGTACNTPTPDQPLTFGNTLCTIHASNNLVWRFKNLSIREIESFEEQQQNPPGGSDPGSGGDPTEPPTDPEPPDTPTPPTPTIIQKRLTIKREIINNAFCQCDGIPDTGSPGGGGGDPGGGSGGGGGGGGSGGSLQTIYNVSQSGAGYAKLASVSKNRDEFYLRYGQIADQSDSVFIGQKIGRIEIFIAEEDKPRGGTGSGVRCLIRKGTNDSIAVDFGTAREEDIHDAGSLFRFDKLDNTYEMTINDKILFEYDGGGTSDYVKIFRKSGQPDTGSKTVHRNNNQDPGEYSTSTRDLCMRVFAVAGTLNADTSDT